MPTGTGHQPILLLSPTTPMQAWLKLNIVTAHIPRSQLKYDYTKFTQCVSAKQLDVFCLARAHNSFEQAQSPQAQKGNKIQCPSRIDQLRSAGI